MRFLRQRELDPLLLGSPLRNTAVALTISAWLLVSLAAVAVTLLAFLGSLRDDVTDVFIAALALSTVMSSVPWTILWYLDRRERETPWLFVAAFLWGAFMATGLALPVNGALLSNVARWVEHNPFALEILGPEAPMLLGAPLAAPLVEEVTKGLGLLLLFFLLRAEFDNMRDGIVYGALIGLGFTWFEAPLYVAQEYAHPRRTEGLAGLERLAIRCGAVVQAAVFDTVVPRLEVQAVGGGHVERAEEQL